MRNPLVLSVFISAGVLAGSPLASAANSLVFCSEGSPAGFDTAQYTTATDNDASEPNLTHRLGLEVRLSGDAEEISPDNPVKDLVPSGGAGNGNRLVAATTTCDSCHERLDLHGGPRHTVEYCVTCHNPGSVDPDSGNSVDMAYMVHSIHAGLERADYSPDPTKPIAMASASDGCIG